MRITLPFCVALLACASDRAPEWRQHAPAAATAPAPALTLDGAWDEAQTAPIIAKTGTVRVAPDLAVLKPGERAAMAKLLEVGAIMQELYEEQRHVDAAAARALVTGLGTTPREEHLRTLYRLFHGPIATTLDNKRVAFLKVKDVVPGKAMYPWGVTAAELDGFLAEHPDRTRELRAPRTVVRQVEPATLARDLDTLRAYPVVDGLHPGLRRRLEMLQGSTGFYAVPYSVAYADRLVRAHRLLVEAADAAQPDAPELAGYLRNRARDLLTDDYEAGDAAWVTADLGNLNAQIGSYETYDDELFGTKTAFSLSLLVRRPVESEAVRSALGGLQALEDSLPYRSDRKVREHIPVGVYDVVADFGQARGGNTATILPNEAYLAQRYGRTILLRGNIMRDPELFAGVDGAWKAVVAPAHATELVPDGNFYRTLWHELGHYLGVNVTRDGRTLDAALGDAADLLEEMKADLVALYLVPALRARGYYDDAKVRAVYAAGINRVLQNNKPRRDQPYQTMQLMQWNFFLAGGVLSFDAATGTQRIDYGRYHEVVGQLLARVLAVQEAGDKPAADAFITELTAWDDALHGVVAQRIRDQQRYRFRVFRYAALGE
jgi:hypothetical protein